MSKLDDNERWKSNMVLTEHVEQYESRGEDQSQRLRRGPTNEELVLIRDHILLPHMLTMVQKSIDDIENSPNILKPLYLAAGRAVMDKISAEMYNIRRELRQRNIKIISDEQVEMVVYHHFVCRGYEERFGMMRDVMRSEISIRLSKYVKEVIGKLAAK
ncbi:hypothetical protein LJK88_37450 [Paenibacillus sp. P26]|nr:hypothetical protein LJK88_37450 [Paenibacillus sp. P26]UUZ93377.1 hypothetical protein LJK87_00860 [Paenibacillus sp. P25]